MSNIGRRNREAEGSNHVVIENNPKAVGTERGYNLVFEGTGQENSNHLGIRTWTSFRDKEDYIQWMRESGNGDKILAEGVTQDEALKYIKQTRLADRTAAVVAASTTKDGEVNPTVLRFNLMNLLMLERFDSGE